MLRLYNLPGRLLAKLNYIFPDKGQAVSSARQLDSAFAHFVYSTIIYGLIVLIVLSKAN